MKNFEETVQKVSVVMCTFNGASYIAEQIESILHQTYPLVELLIFDDASTDNTFEILTSFQAKNSILRVFRNPENIGFTKNFEQALKAAKGDVIAISDQDDIWLDTKIEEMIKAWDPKCSLIYCESKMFHNTIPENSVPNPKWQRFEGTDARKIFLFNCVSGHASLIRRTLLSLILPFENGVMYDWWMAVVAANNGGVQYYPKVLVYQRSHNTNITINNKERTLTDKERWPSYKAYLRKHLKQFATATSLPKDHQVFAIKFHELLGNVSTKFNTGLFIFFMKHRLLLFNYKKRKIGIFSYLKHSFIRSITLKNLN